MKSLHRSVVIASLCLLTASAGYAQQDGKDGKDIPVQQAPKTASPDEWHFSFTPYIFLPTVNLDISVPDVTVGNHIIGGDISIVQPWWETLGKFSSNFYVLSLGSRLEAWKGRWGGFLDGYYIWGKSTVDRGDSRLVFRDRPDITLSSSVTSRFHTGQFNFGPQYMLGTAPLSATSSVSFVLYGGGRVNWVGDNVDGTITIVESANPGEIGQTASFTSDKSRAFIEPMIGLKSSWAFSKKVKGEVRGDVGGFGVVTANNWDCDLEAAIAWEAWRNTYLDFGYRARGQWQDLGSNNNANIRGWYYGPEVGVTFNF